MKYIYLSILLACSVSLSNAKTVYTDVNPDVMSSLDPGIVSMSNVAPIDFNNDGTNEYNFSWTDLSTTSMEWRVHCNFSGNNEFMLNGSTTSPSGSRYLMPLSAGTTIGPSGSFGNSSPDPLIADNNNGNFQNLGDQYIGVKFTIGASIYYGWILVSFDMGKNLIVKEYAYEDLPNTSIDAGQKTTPIIPVSSIAVNGQAGASTITTNQGTLQMEAVVLPANATDKTVNWSVTNGTGDASISTTGLLTAISNGTVTVRADANDGSMVSGNKVITISNQDVKVASIAVQGQGGASVINTNDGTLQMMASILPANATNQTVTWSVVEVSGKASIDAAGLLTAIEDGIVTVVATANDGSTVSGSTDISISNQTAGINDVTVYESPISLYPNPSSAVIHLTSVTSKPLGNVSIHTMDGRLSYQTNVTEPSAVIDISSLNKGTYFMTIQSNSNGTYSRRIVKTL